VTISYVVPLLMALQHKLQSQLATVRFHQPLVRELLRSLFDRFGGLYRQLSVSSPTVIGSAKTDLHFDSPVFMMASSVDPEHGYRWLQWHSGTVAEKEQLKTKIFAELLTVLNKCTQSSVSTTAVSPDTCEPSTSTASHAAASAGQYRCCFLKIHKPVISNNLSFLCSL